MWDAENGDKVAPLMVGAVAPGTNAKQETIVGIVEIVREGRMKILLFFMTAPPSHQERTKIRHTPPPKHIHVQLQQAY